MLNITGPVNNLSYGLVTRNIVEQIPECTLFPIAGRVDVNPSKVVHKCIERGMDRSVLWKEYDPSNPCIRIWHAHDMSSFYGKERIGWPIFELEEFTEQEVKHLRSLDKVIVCSHWAKQVIENHVDVPVEVVPLGVNTDIFNYKEEKRTDKVIFLNIGKWEVRKGHKVLHHAFKEAFPNENVELWMSCHNPFYDNSSWEQEYREKLGDKVKFLPFVETQGQLATIINKADVCVFPTSCEGFGLPILESLACGKQVVTTNVTAQTEYVTPENSILIEGNGKVPARDGVFFHHGYWNDFKFDDIVESLRLAYGRARERNVAGERTGRDFSWAKSGDVIRRRICGIEDSC